MSGEGTVHGGIAVEESRTCSVATQGELEVWIYESMIVGMWYRYHSRGKNNWLRYTRKPVAVTIEVFFLIFTRRHLLGGLRYSEQYNSLASADNDKRT